MTSLHYHLGSIDTSHHHDQSLGSIVTSHHCHQWVGSIVNSLHSHLGSIDTSHHCHQSLGSIVTSELQTVWDMAWSTGNPANFCTKQYHCILYCIVLFSTVLYKRPRPGPPVRNMANWPTFTPGLLLILYSLVYTVQYTVYWYCTH